MYTFYDPQSGRVFSSPNMRMAPPTEILPAVRTWDDLVENFTKLRFMSAKHPQLPFAFSSPIWSGPLFNCLRGSYRQLPIVNSNETFTLNSQLLEKWVILDNFLTQVFRTLSENRPNDVVLHPVPSDCHYTITHPTDKAARTAAWRTLGAFQHLLALVAWAISRSMKHTKDTSWVDHLLSNGVPPSLVEMLRGSNATTFSLECPRLGTVVDIKDSASLKYVRPMVDAQVPVYLYWGICEPYTKPKFDRLPDSVLDGWWINNNCFPSEAILKDALMRHSLPVPSSSTNAPPSAGPALVTPPPIKGSSQRHGETWKEFFTRRARANSATAEKQSLAERKKREQRSKHAKAGDAPGRKGANVFYWEESNGHRIRTSIGYDHYQGIWNDYHGSQRRYDPFGDEWDLCTEFEPDAEPSESNVFDDFDSDDEVIMSSKKRVLPPSVDTSSTVVSSSCPSHGLALPDTVSQMSSDNSMSCDALPYPPASACKQSLISDPTPAERLVSCDPPPTTPLPLCDLQSLSGDVPPTEVEDPMSGDIIPDPSAPSGNQSSSSDPPSTEAPLPPTRDPQSASGDVPPTKVEDPMSGDTIPDPSDPSGNQSSPSDPPSTEVPVPCPSATALPPTRDPQSASGDVLPIEVEDPMLVDASQGNIVPATSTVPSNSPPDPQASSNPHPASVFVGDIIPENQAPPTIMLQEVLEQCYGFNISSTAPQTNEGICSLALKIGEGASSLPMGTSLRNAVAAFLEQLTKAQPFNPSICDMLDGSLEEQYMTGYLTIQRREGHHIAIDGTKTAKIFYMVTSKDKSSCPFIVFLEDPIAALYSIRAQSGPDLPDIVAQLARKGFSVNTRVLLGAVPSSVYTTPSGLGFLPFEYRPHSSDYVAYLERREALLRRNYGRAAILKGGIIGRLARESLGDRADFVAGRGPSDDVVRFGSCVEIEGTRYWDDDLDCEDEEIICGVYKLSTGQRHNRNCQQTADVSWWPKQSTWLTSGLNLSHWSADDESWYQKHLEHICNYDGKGHPPYRSAAQWRNALKYHKDAVKKSRDHATRTARDWIEAHT